jgi:hypothetical protein
VDGQVEMGTVRPALPGDSYKEVDVTSKVLNVDTGKTAQPYVSAYCFFDASGRFWARDSDRNLYSNLRMDPAQIVERG